jgi:hypothetical protein
MDLAIGFAVSVLALAGEPAGPPPRPSIPGAEAIRSASAPAAAAFIENVGQWETPIRFVGPRRDGIALFLSPDALWIQLVLAGPEARDRAAPSGAAALPCAAEGAGGRGVNLRLALEGSGARAGVAGADRSPTRFRYFLGNDPSRWREEVPGFGKAVYEDVVEGIDLVVRGEGRGFEYDLHLDRGADLSRVVFRVEGGSSPLRLGEGGSLVLETSVGAVRQPRPEAWEEAAGGSRRAVACAFHILGPDRFGFEVPGRSPGSSLFVDPQLLYSTFLGGSDPGNPFAPDAPQAIAYDPAGFAVVAGWTESPNFPTTPGAFLPAIGGGPDGFVTRLPLAGGPPSHSTFLGGNGADFVAALALDATGAVVLGGYTNSNNLPTTPGAFDATFNSVSSFYRDAFVARLPLAGGPPVYSTYLGGSLHDSVYALALDAAGEAVVAGHTFSTNFPVTAGAYDTSFNGPSTVPVGGDAFVARLPLTGGPPSYSTFLGGAGQDAARALALDGPGLAVVAGQTYSTDFPTTPGAFDTTLGGAVDAFVTWLPFTGGPPSGSTYLGGSGGFEEWATVLALDSTSGAVLAGYTGAADFPTTPGAFDTSLAGTFDAFVSRLPVSGGPPSYSTYLGGSGADIAYAIALDATGASLVAGYTDSPGFPSTPGAFQTALTGFNQDAFVSRVALSGGAAWYSTFLGGAFHDQALALALDATGTALVAGTTASPGFPTTAGAFDTSYNGGTNDGFVTHMTLLPTGAASYGASSPGCAGALALGVTSAPTVGNASFSLICGNAPPNGTGVLGFSGAPLATSLSILGVQVWIDPGSPAFFTVPVGANAAGVAQVPVPIPSLPLLAGASVYAQLVFLGPASPPPCPPSGFSASTALAITVQPWLRQENLREEDGHDVT